MITRPYLISIALTAIVFVAFPFCMWTFPSMVFWVAMASGYLVYVVGVFIDHIERSQLALRAESLACGNRPPQPNPTSPPPFRLIGASEKPLRFPMVPPPNEGEQ